VRRLVTLLVAVAATVTVSAQAANTLSLSIKLSAVKVLYGHAITLSGRLSSGLSGRAVTVESRPLGQSMHAIATVETGRNGGWALRVKPAIATGYEARSGSMATPTLSVGVEPALQTRLLARGGIWVHAAAGRSLAGRAVELQRRSGAHWATIAQQALDRRSDAVLPAPIAEGSLRVRVAMSVNEAGRGLLGATTDPLVYRAPRLSVSIRGAIAGATPSVVYGHGIALIGRVSSGRAGELVVVMAHRYGSAGRTMIRVLSRAGGRFMWSATPRIQTSYQARWDGRTSGMLVVGVRPQLSVSRMAGGRLAVSVAPLRAFLGRTVELQQRSGAGWRTIDQLPLLAPAGEAVFSSPALGRPGTTLRFAMSVNEAGAGYLGASTKPIVYRARFVSIVPSSTRVLYGHAFRLSGVVSSRQAGQQVVVLARRYGQPSPSEAVTVLTGPGGRWSLEAAPSIQTTYLARWGASSSRAITVGVQPRISVLVLGSGLVATRVAAGRSLRGALVELQALMPGDRWSTIMRRPLDRRASAVFSPQSSAADATLRVAMSVNQAGAGLLGASSHAFDDPRL
jgi:hypothetical protein